jgi:hypothetical protein
MRGNRIVKKGRGIGDCGAIAAAGTGVLGAGPGYNHVCSHASDSVGRFLFDTKYSHLCYNRN